MALISGEALYKLIDNGVINAKKSNVNGASIDITLDSGSAREVGYELGFNEQCEEIIGGFDENGRGVENECNNYPQFRLVELSDKSESIQTKTISGGGNIYITPGEFILVSSLEVFNLPDNIAAQYVLKSSMMRNGLNALNAGWCDPGWRNSKLTIGLQNVTKYHELILKPGMKIGQMKFFKCDPVPDQLNYGIKVGRYNNQQGVTGSKGIE